MKSKETPGKVEASLHDSPSSARETGEDEAGRPMRLLIAIQGYYGERMVENIRRHCPADWEVNDVTLPTGSTGNNRRR